MFKVLKNSPITALIFGDSMGSLHSISEGLPNGDVLQSLRIESPPFYKFARRMCAEDVTLVKPIIDELSVPFNYLLSFTAHETGAANPADSHEYFPHLPLVHSRGKYEMDKSKTADDRKLCEKAFPSHKTLSPGLFTIHCPHGRWISAVVCLECLHLWCDSLIAVSINLYPSHRHAIIAIIIHMTKSNWSLFKPMTRAWIVLK